MRPPRCGPRRRDRPVEQIVPMRRTFPQFRPRWNRAGGLEWRGSLQPTPDSPVYPIRIVHKPGLQPQIFVPGHELNADCNHLYGDSSLCLYWPKEWWWTPGESLVETLVPWSAFWLYYYELWETTGVWLGPSSPHGLRAAERN